jgi:hypothetical protein
MPIIFQNKSESLSPNGLTIIFVFYLLQFVNAVGVFCSPLNEFIDERLRRN